MKLTNARFKIEGKLIGRVSGLSLICSGVLYILWIALPPYSMREPKSVGLTVGVVSFATLAEALGFTIANRIVARGVGHAAVKLRIRFLVMYSIVFYISIIIINGASTIFSTNLKDSFSFWPSFFAIVFGGLVLLAFIDVSHKPNSPTARAETTPRIDAPVLTQPVTTKNRDEKDEEKPQQSEELKRK